MAGIGEVTPGLIAVEDLAVTTVPAGDTFTANVLGAGSQTLTKIPITLLTQLASAANDAAAAVAGVSVGVCYYNTTDQKLHTRMT